MTEKEWLGLKDTECDEFVKIRPPDFFFAMGSRFHLPKKSAWRLLKVFKVFRLAEYNKEIIRLHPLLYYYLLLDDKNGGRRD